MLPSVHIGPCTIESRFIARRVYHLQVLLFGLLVACCAKAEPTLKLGIYFDVDSGPLSGLQSQDSWSYE